MRYFVSCADSSSHLLLLFVVVGKDPVATAKLLGHQDTASLLAYLRVASEELRKVDEEAVKEYLGMIKDAEKGIKAGADGKDAKQANDNEGDVPLEQKGEKTKAFTQDLLSEDRPEQVDVTGKRLDVEIGQDRDKGKRAFTPAELALLEQKGWSTANKPAATKLSPKQLSKQQDQLAETRARMLAIIFSLCAFGCRVGGLLALQVRNVYNVHKRSWYKSLKIYDKGTDESRKRAEKREQEKKTKKQKPKKQNASHSGKRAPSSRHEQETEDEHRAKRAKVTVAASARSTSARAMDLSHDHPDADAPRSAAVSPAGEVDAVAMSDH